MPDRREKIRAMLDGNPDDQTLLYMLAMECDKAGDDDEALDLFQQLMNDTTPYVPAFLMAGQLLARLDRTDEARQIYTLGIEEAQKQDNAHAAGEMTAFRDDLPDDQA